ncbi:arabinan endo-1,5-alpha-L-arabinosidase [Streptomyces nanhaiensis]|uniref:arabinan endo-1,5-alpha-L-arabinosidase n=1 Tax=Streptomyces nanhaiensis TaxID=679319 RepID=UPI00399C7F5B
MNSRTPHGTSSRPPSRTHARRAHVRRALTALAAALLGTLVALVPGSASAYPGPGLVTGDVSVHDPSMVRLDDGRYILYSTHNGPQARISTDRTRFTHAGAAFPDPPSWWGRYSPERSPWAPDVSKQGGRYWLYYSLSTFGSNHSAIGVATSPSGLPGTWTDHGPVHTTTTGSDHNAIDPSLFVDDDGKWWMTFGSWWTGIKMIRLDPSTGKQHPGDRTLYSVAARNPTSNGIEGPTLVKRGGHYYLFASFDKCCAGTDSTYSIRVGRSTSPTGPFRDRDGVDMRDNGGTVVLETHGQVVGPGGQSVMSDVDGDLLVYHYYDRGNNGSPTLGINLMRWEGGWPVVH